MKSPVRTAFLPLLLLLVPVPRAAEEYPLPPESVAQPGVPRGDLLTFEFTGSKIFPGTTREVPVYVPRQYDPAKPACVYVSQDGVEASTRRWSSTISSPKRKCPCSSACSSNRAW